MGPSGPLAPDGACYVEIASFDRGAFCHHTVEEAISVWRQRLLDYVSANPGDVLWWRDRPEIQGNVPFGSTRLHWLVYSRLRIGYDGKVDRNVAEMLADNVFGSAEQPVQKIRMVER
jgi:hypothetical protein